MNKPVDSMDAAWQSSPLYGQNSAYLEALYEQYLEAPESVEASVRQLFDGLAADNHHQDVAHSPVREAFKRLAQQPASAGGDINMAYAHKLSAVMDLVYAYRFVGHMHANLDPLGRVEKPNVEDLTLAYHGLTDADLEESFDIPGLEYVGSHKLKDIIAELKRVYCGHIATQYMHITNNEEKQWVRSKIECANGRYFDADKKRWLHQQLVAADTLEKYLGRKYVGQKRFSLEGGDALIPMMNEMVNQACHSGVEEVVMAMSHRGRLNVLVNVVGKSPKELIDEFEGEEHQALVAGDVKYHKGFSSDIKTPYGDMHLAMAFNPSHLEIATPVVEGSVRARQDRRECRTDKVMAIRVHGDAAFAGQGVVMESLNMSQTRGYRTGGSIHIVVNNQVGFTTSHHLDTRSSYYCTDVARMIEVPIFHVNGDDPEAVLFVAQMAMEYRTKFHKDVVIDLVCYRLNGHNESDEPSVTQPLMYKAIKQHQTPYKLYAQQLEVEGLLDANAAKQVVNDYVKQMEKGAPVVQYTKHPDPKYMIDWSPYIGVPWYVANSQQRPKAELIELGKKLTQLPEGFTPQKQVKRTLDERKKMTQEAIPANWGYAELLAYANLLSQGYNVRISGQDIRRGTFAHRHAVLHDFNNGSEFSPLADNIAQHSLQFTAIDSLLSEEGVLGFEYGYATSSPNSLVIWEAQFGDFANCAQVMIDQFISSAEEKWGRLSGITLFLPHGQEGMGAEHSSARLERFLQLCAHDNMQVCVPTTPAQHYHLICRQMMRPYRKPLIVMTPKSLLRHPLVTSSLDELAEGQFELVLPEQEKQNVKKVKRVVLCQGKVYYDLLIKRREENIDDIAIVRIEQLYPFPRLKLAEILKPYQHVDDFIWCQEEPENQGAWHIIQHRIRKALTDKQTLNYAGREAFAAPAVGYPQLAKAQQEALVRQALNLKMNGK